MMVPRSSPASDNCMRYMSNTYVLVDIPVPGHGSTGDPRTNVPDRENKSLHLIADFLRHMRLISPSHQPRFGVTRSLFLTTCISKNWLYCSLTFHTTSSTLKAGMVFMHDSLWVIGRRKQREACVEQTQDGERRLTVHFFVDTAGYRPSVITMRRRREEHGGLIHTQVSVSLRALDHPGPHRTVRARRCWRESRAQFHVCRVPSHTTLRTHRSTTASAQYPGRYRGRGSAPGHGFRFLPAHRPHVPAQSSCTVGGQSHLFRDRAHCRHDRSELGTCHHAN